MHTHTHSPCPLSIDYQQQQVAKMKVCERKGERERTRIVTTWQGCCCINNGWRFDGDGQRYCGDHHFTSPQSLPLPLHFTSLWLIARVGCRREIDTNRFNQHCLLACLRSFRSVSETAAAAANGLLTATWRNCRHWPPLKKAVDANALPAVAAAAV